MIKKTVALSIMLFVLTLCGYLLFNIAYFFFWLFWTPLDQNKLMSLGTMLVVIVVGYYVCAVGIDSLREQNRRN
ncbi:MAG: hypothetical protein K2W82_11250 [Candidatus Obscuribacterales bacterium]|nr:hypothetical protein [Candidatus Obscuribacterales bacterium]